jgi:hypothetical protein
MTRRPSTEEAREAIAKYKEFHRFDPRQIGKFPASFRIPERMFRAGPAKFVCYRSGKVDPETLRKPSKPVNYIHEHDAGVVCYLRNRTVYGEGAETAVPREFIKVDALTRLGFCLGFCFEDDGRPQEVEGRDPLPDLYTTPDGRCLLVIQSRKTVLAMMWGGALGVFARGIDG